MDSKKAATRMGKDAISVDAEVCDLPAFEARVPEHGACELIDAGDAALDSEVEVINQFSSPRRASGVR